MIIRQIRVICVLFFHDFFKVLVIIFAVMLYCSCWGDKMIEAEEN